MEIKHTLGLFLATVTCLASASSAMAGFVNLSTGASYDINGVDANWKVTSINPADKSFTGSAYVATPVGAWVSSDLAGAPASKWITYSSPTQTGGDSGHYYTYELNFTSSAQTTILSWSTDNSGVMYLDGKEIGQTGNTAYASWNTINDLLLTSGTHTLDVVVYNSPQDSGNPTGLRVAFGVNTDAVSTAVPEASTIFSGFCLILPFGIGMIRSFRKK